MGFEFTIESDIAVLKVGVARLDARIAPELKKVVSGIVNDGTGRIILDLEGVEFMDSSGLGAIISCFKSVGPKGEFVICNMGEAVKEIFTLTHMDRIFEIYPDANDGLEKMCA